MKGKKLLVVMLAVVMLLGCGVTSFAADPCATGCTDCECGETCNCGGGTRCAAGVNCACENSVVDKNCGCKDGDPCGCGDSCECEPCASDCACKNTGDEGNGGNEETGSGSTTEQTTTTTTTTTNTSKSSSKSKGSSSGSSSSANPAAKPAGASISVGGKSVATTVNGTYEAKNVQGVAVTSAAENIKASLGLSANQTPYVTVYDTDPKKSEKAMDSINAAVEAMGGGTIAASLNIDMGAKENGKYVALENGSVGMVVGLPANVGEGAAVCIVCVRPGGAVTILQDTDSDPKTVTFEVQAGLGTYAIVTQ